MSLFWRLRNGTKISDAKFVRSYLELFLGGGSYENPRENQVGGICVRARLYHEYKMSATTAKQNGPRKPNMFYVTFDYSPLNQARTRTFSVLPGQARPVQTSLYPQITIPKGPEHFSIPDRFPFISQ
jgi:hypothetical protein